MPGLANCKKLLLVSLCLTTACTTTLLGKQEYSSSLSAYYRSNPQKALDEFPVGEENTLITTLEKTYLNLLLGRPEIQELEKFAKLVDERTRYKVSREIDSLFYAETPEGYYASEHEIIWLHMLLSWGYSMRKEYNKGCVEARKGSHLLTLSAPWSEHEGHFDDALLRVILGSLWAMCGSWEDAQVDFRVAASLNPSLQWAQELADRNNPPRHLFIVLGGVGPVISWAAKSEVDPVKEMKFTMQGRRSPLNISDTDNTRVNTSLTSDSSYWYQRHLQRDNAIHELILLSHYGSNYAIAAGMESGKRTLAVATGIVIGTVSIAAGIQLLIWAAKSDGRLAIFGIVTAIAGTDYGIDIAGRSISDSRRSMQQKTDRSAQYRFARFLPEYAWVGWSDETLKEPFDLVPQDGTQPNLSTELQTYSDSLPYVSIGHFADVDESADYWYTDTLWWGKWKSEVISYMTRPTSTDDSRWKIYKQQQQFKELGRTGFRSKIHPSGRRIWMRFDGNKQIITLEIGRGLFEENQMITINLSGYGITTNSEENFLFHNISPELLVQSMEAEFQKKIDNEIRKQQEEKER